MTQVVYGMKRLPVFFIPALLLLLASFRMPKGAAYFAGQRSYQSSYLTPQAGAAVIAPKFTPAILETLTPTADLPGKAEASSTASPTFTPTETAAENLLILDLFMAFLPFIEHHLPTPTPTDTLTPSPTPSATPDIRTRDYLFCDDLTRPLPIPDNDPLGKEASIVLSEPGIVVDVDVYIDIDHTWIGDISLRLSHQESGRSITLMDRPGKPATDNGCPGDDMIAILDDSTSSYVEGKCADTVPSISGTFKPEEALSTFEGETAAGSWILQVSDGYPGDTGRLVGWCIELQVAGALPPPAPTATPIRLPPSAYVNGVSGRDQAMPLDCESRTAVDWARFFGYAIDEYDFFYNLPTSDNPEKGFVGDPYGAWGQIPPNDYGVHAPPVAALLRRYGVPAYAHRYLRWRDLKAEIAAGRPVIVWEIGQVWRGIPVYYIARDGNFTVVARYEHTVMVVGYTQDSVSIQDGSKRYTRPLEDFLDSWSVLRNMAILAHP